MHEGLGKDDVFVQAVKELFNKTVGQKWYYGFKKRWHTELQEHTVQLLTKQRVNSSQLEAISKFCAQVELVSEQLYCLSEDTVISYDATQVLIATNGRVVLEQSSKTNKTLLGPR